MRSSDSKVAPVQAHDGQPRAGAAAAREAILRTIRERWREYFPDLADCSPPEVLASPQSAEHGYSVIHAYTLCFRERRARLGIIAKLRRGSYWSMAEGAGALRRAASLAKMEYRELSAAHRFFSNRAGPCGVVRPLDYIEEQNALLIERARGRDLGLLVTEDGPEIAGQLIRTGKWLRHFHDDVHRRFEHPWSPEDFGAALGTRTADLVRLGVPRTVVGEIEAAVLGSAEAFRGRETPGSTLHGDYKLRHVWATRDAIQVLDFGNVHEGDCYEDVAAMLVELRVLCLARPFASPASADRYARAFLQGYFGEDRIPPLLHCYVIESLAKKWSRRLLRWTGHPVAGAVQAGLERLGLKGAVDRLWLDRWFIRAIHVELERLETHA